ncbi:MAG: NUDIX domain-containing protein [Euryarchaeota archaeon]|nr:NUDIX domain-containing protein [Euryarchaeota archaeon]
MSWVYAIAFHDGRFLMALNPKRGGWEMPGGRVEEGESPEAASIREFVEETGQRFVPVASMPCGRGAVFTGLLQVADVKGEFRWELFDALPRDLSFPEAEYIEQVEWARKEMERWLLSHGDNLKS